MHDVEGIERIRFATSHPRYFTERLIRACSEMPKMMPVRGGAPPRPRSC